MRDDMVVLHVRQILVQRCELMEVRGEQAETSDLACDVPSISIIYI